MVMAFAACVGAALSCIYPIAELATRADGGDAEAGVGDGEAGVLEECNAPDLVAAWKFDEGEGGVAHDCTGHGFDALLKADAGWAPGKSGGASLDLTPVNLTAGAFAEVSTPDGLRFAGPITVASRVFYRSFGYAGRIFASSTYASDLGLELTGEVPGFFSAILYQDLPDGNFIETHSDTQPGTTLTWMHVALVFDGASLKTYRDGKLEGNESTPSGLTRRVGLQPVFIGRRTDCCFLDGRIDDLRVYRRALTSEEIAALASAP